MRRLASILLFVLLAIARLPGADEFKSGKVVGVHDGDTLTILSERIEVKVRLYGIDAPELGQPFGRASKKALSELVFGKMVEVEVSGTDRWGRSIGRVKLGSRDISLEMVTAGMAWWYREYAGNDTGLETAETAAKTAGVGLWSEDAPVAPWEWRKKIRPKRKVITKPKPLEDGSVTISRSAGKITLPCSFMPVAAMTPCPCGYLGDTKRECRCGPTFARETPWHHSQQLIERPDGRCELILRLNGLEDARIEVLRWGSHAEVISPAPLRTDVLSELQGALARYGGGTPAPTAGQPTSGAPG